MLAYLIIKEFFLDVAFGTLMPLERPHAVAIVFEEDSMVVASCGAAARKAGVRPGMPEPEARALFPKGSFAVVDRVVAEEAFAKVLNLLESFSPTFQALGIGSALLDLGVIPDLERVQQEAKGLITGLERKSGHVASLGLAEGRFAANVAARLAGPGQAIIVPAGDEAIFLQGQPVACLPVNHEILRRLDLLGIETIGDLAKLPEDDLVNLFGDEGCLMAALARGQDETLVAAERLIEALSGNIDFDFPLEGGELILGEVVQILEGLCDRLREKHQMATRIRVTIGVMGHEKVSISLHLASPSHDAARIIQPLRDRLASLSLPGPIATLEVALEGFVDSHARQLTLASLLPKAERWRNIQRIVERLSVRTEKATLMQVVWDDLKSRIPEWRGHLQDMIRETQRRGLYLPRPVNVAADPSGAPRLVRTGRGWEPVETIVEAWEVDEDWWTPRPIARSYYRVLLRNGAVMRLFRDQRRGSWYHQNR